MKIITEQDVKRAELENKAMNLRREELQKEDKKLLKQINKNIEIIEKFKRIKKCKKSTEEKEERKTGNMTKSEKEKLTEEQKIYEFIKNKSPFYYRSKEVGEWTKIHPTECTEIVKELIEKGKITIIKKGRYGIYGATLSTSENIQGAEVVS